MIGTPKQSNYSACANSKRTIKINGLNSFIKHINMASLHFISDYVIILK